ncbi:hypothetical protein PHYBOEH_004421 [Phytophthora boehmeriae]|uniref:Uncharacterized protein n=1 Tax=Phytophthora boehmeriae TaxID=109152 RepID=A0A8T1WTE3_9STRA|nr:hypothetical protein PHYBOEH_004421 [Phytophthora boehmeriae]
MEFVTQAQPMTDQPFFSLDFNDEVSRELSSTITRLYMEADTAVPVVNDTLTVSLHSHYWHRSSCCETSSITHLACPVQEAGDMLWDYYSSAATKIVQDTFRFVPAASNERKWAMTLLVQDKDGTLSSVNGVATYRKYEEANRVVMVGTMMWFLPNEGVQLEDKTWTLITPSTDSSSVIQTSYQLQVKKTGIKQHTHMLETILNYIGEQSRCCLQHQQNLYLDKVLARNTSLCTNEQ